MNPGLMKIGVLNVRSLYGKEKLLQEELKKQMCPFEIIPLQITRKENNWKTEEALARAAVTLETERIKGSNP